MVREGGSAPGSLQHGAPQRPSAALRLPHLREPHIESHLSWAFKSSLRAITVLGIPARHPLVSGLFISSSIFVTFASLGRWTPLCRRARWPARRRGSLRLPPPRSAYPPSKWLQGGQQSICKRGRRFRAAPAPSAALAPAPTARPPAAPPARRKSRRRLRSQSGHAPGAGKRPKCSIPSRSLRFMCAP